MKLKIKYICILVIIFTTILTAQNSEEYTFDSNPVAEYKIDNDNYYKIVAWYSNDLFSYEEIYFDGKAILEDWIGKLNEKENKYYFETSDIRKKLKEDFNSNNIYSFGPQIFYLISNSKKQISEEFEIDTVTYNIKETIHEGFAKTDNDDSLLSTSTDSFPDFNLEINDVNGNKDFNTLQLRIKKRKNGFSAKYKLLNFFPNLKGKYLDSFGNRTDSHWDFANEIQTSFKCIGNDTDNGNAELIICCYGKEFLKEEIFLGEVNLPTEIGDTEIYFELKEINKESELNTINYYMKNKVLNNLHWKNKEDEEITPYITPYLLILDTEKFENYKISEEMNFAEEGNESYNNSHKLLFVFYNPNENTEDEVVDDLIELFNIEKPYELDTDYKSYKSKPKQVNLTVKFLNSENVDISKNLKEKFKQEIMNGIVIKINGEEQTLNRNGSNIGLTPTGNIDNAELTIDNNYVIEENSSISNSFCNIILNLIERNLTINPINKNLNDLTENEKTNFRNNLRLTEQDTYFAGKFNPITVNFGEGTINVKSFEDNPEINLAEYDKHWEQTTFKFEEKNKIKFFVNYKLKVTCSDPEFQDSNIKENIINKIKKQTGMENHEISEKKIVFTINTDETDYNKELNFEDKNFSIITDSGKELANIIIFENSVLDSIELALVKAVPNITITWNESDYRKWKQYCNMDSIHATLQPPVVIYEITYGEDNKSIISYDTGLVQDIEYGIKLVELYNNNFFLKGNTLRGATQIEIPISLKTSDVTIEYEYPEGEEKIEKNEVIIKALYNDVIIGKGDKLKKITLPNIMKDKLKFEIYSDRYVFDNNYKIVEINGREGINLTLKRIWEEKNYTITNSGNCNKFRGVIKGFSVHGDVKDTQETYDGLKIKLPSVIFDTPTLILPKKRGYSINSVKFGDPDNVKVEIPTDDQSEINLNINHLSPIPLIFIDKSRDIGSEKSEDVWVGIDGIKDHIETKYKDAPRIGIFYIEDDKLVGKFVAFKSIKKFLYNNIKLANYNQGIAISRLNSLNDSWEKLEENMRNSYYPTIDIFLAHTTIKKVFSSFDIEDTKEVLKELTVGLLKPAAGDTLKIYYPNTNNIDEIKKRLEDEEDETVAKFINYKGEK